MPFAQQNYKNVAWTQERAKEIFDLPFMEVIYQAHSIHRQNFNPNDVQISTLLNVKTGGCPENCSYCPQSAFYKTAVSKEPLMDKEKVMEYVKRAKKAGSTRFCMAAAWRGPRDSDLKGICELVKAIKNEGMETCASLGLLKEGQAEKLNEAGLDFYNHNIDTSPEFYDKIITTRKFEDRIDTLNKVRESGMKVCCGGILGMGESDDDRISMLVTLANLSKAPESVTVNKLIQIPGTPLEHQKEIDSFSFVRVIALARIMMPQSYVRLSAGRKSMSDELQALCFFSGANSIHYGEKLLTTKNVLPEEDQKLFAKLGIQSLTKFC